MYGRERRSPRARQHGSSDPWDWAKARNTGDSSFKPPVTTNGDILLVLRYPKEHTLTTRAVIGEMRSTSAQSSVQIRVGKKGKHCLWKTE